jgi:L-seryl-tRNA(Ser) seleniumtransferase
VVSRGELIEIGGSFRIPEVMAQSNALLREVGTTNRTHLKDYEQALNENTALLLKVHTSNYKIVGFTKEVSLKEMARLGASRGIPTMFDLGSGCLVDLSGFGLRGEPTVRQALESGVDLVSLSGDKLLGGPQAGILAGRGDLIERMRSNPLARALRMDKMTLAGLEATLQAYVTPEGPFKEIPTLAMLSKSEEELARDARELAGAIEQGLANELAVTLEEGEGRVGGGSLPIAALNAQRVKLRPKRIRAAELERRLRASEPPLIVLIQDDAVVLDTRTLLRDQKRMIPGILERAFAR